MRRIKRWFYTVWWLLKTLFLKLTPTRRLLVVIGLAMLIFANSIHYQDRDDKVQIQTNDLALVGGAMLLFVLMLELKDKLIARDELEAGRAVQAELMPESSPAVPGWSLWLFTRTANEVGGDLVDFLPLPDQRFGITLADVAGKGLKAALLTAKLQATLRALAPETPKLATLGARVNHIFCRDGIRSMFASFVYIDLIPELGKIRLVNAGHLPPLILRGGEIVELPKGDPAIGLKEEVEFHEREETIAPGEIVVVYSDGLTDAKNERDEFYGTQRVRQVLFSARDLSAPELGGSIVRDVDGFIGEARVFDDLSVVVLKRER